MRNHLLKLSFAVLLGGALAGSACSSSNGQPTGSAGHGGSTVGTAGTSGTAGTTGTGEAPAAMAPAAVSREPTVAAERAVVLAAPAEVAPAAPAAGRSIRAPG